MKFISLSLTVKKPRVGILGSMPQRHSTPFSKTQFYFGAKLLRQTSEWSLLQRILEWDN